MPTPASQIFAQALTGAITLTYGLAFLGLWLQYRRAAMREFALAWLVFGLLSALTVLRAAGIPGYSMDIGTPLERVTSAAAVACAMLTVFGMAYAAAGMVDRNAPRRRLARTGVTLAAATAALALLGIPAITTILIGFLARALASVVMLWALFHVWRATSFVGRRSLAWTLALLLTRFSVGFLAVLVISPTTDVGTAQRWLNVIELFATIGAGFFSTVAVFAVEREAVVLERVAVAREAAQAQRMESLGRMAGSVAHDFNNILAAVLGAAEELQTPGASEADRAAAARDISHAVFDGKDLTKRLLAFSRPRPSSFDSFDPVSRLDELIPMLQRLAGTGVRVVHERAPGLRAGMASTLGDAVAFDQLFLNLTANARDAMPDGGELRLHSDLLNGGAPSAPAGLNDGPHLRVVVADTGSGIDPEIVPRIFEPYFTTKAPGQGTGLGLSGALGFVRDAGGQITVESVPSRGTTFSIYLPVTSS